LSDGDKPRIKQHGQSTRVKSGTCQIKARWQPISRSDWLQ